ncbi:MAG: response regulator transcription factor [Lachnospiraceae bacterium]|nr:response regulator transcription factor [Lachnospiraceae bacterium]
MHYNCLIVDDEEDLAKMTCEYFQLFDVSCTWRRNLSDTESFLLENQADTLLLDINLEGESGFRFCKKLRETSEIPILFISARDSDEDVLAALNIGGDDYIQKPYTLSVLLAKVKVLLRRIAQYQNQNRAQEENKVPPLDAKDKNGGLYLDKETRSVYLDGQKRELKAKEFLLMQCLYEHRNKIVTKKQLFDEVWGDAFYSDGTLNVHIRRLREKLEEDPNVPKLIKTVWGTGYMLEYGGENEN